MTDLINKIYNHGEHGVGARRGIPPRWGMVRNPPGRGTAGNSASRVISSSRRAPTHHVAMPLPLILPCPYLYLFFSVLSVNSVVINASDSRRKLQR
jgi:hypothetical protein